MNFAPADRCQRLLIGYDWQPRGPRMSIMSDERCRQVMTADGLSLSVFFQAAPDARRTVVFLHGLAGDRDEVGDIIRRTAERLPAHQFDTVRFDFRGHGEHAEFSREMTLGGEANDLGAVMEAMSKVCAPVEIFVAASLGAVPLMLHLAKFGMTPPALVLWNPVLDHYRTFVEPGTSWSRSAFAAFACGGAEADLDGFIVGSGFWRDLNDRQMSDAAWATAQAYAGDGLIIHGDEDQIVPYAYSKELSAVNPRWTLSTYEGAKHGLDGFHDRLINETVAWLLRHR